MKRGLNIQLNFTNRFIYTFIALTTLIIVGAGVFAFGTAVPGNFGHSAGELDLSTGVNGDALFNGGVTIAGILTANSNAVFTGGISSPQYCDENGANCKTITELAGSGTDLTITRVYATWSGFDKTQELQLSNGGLTAFHPANNIQPTSARATIGKSSGKWYWEITIDNTYHTAPGIAPPGAVIDYNAVFNDELFLYSTFFNPDTIRNSQVVKSVNLNAEAGSTIMFALDLDNDILWIGVDGVWADNGNPSTGNFPTLTNIFGTWHPLTSGERGTSDTVNFGADLANKPFQHPTPTGFNPGVYNEFFTP